MTTVMEWERRLEEDIKYVELIGELDLPRSWASQFGALIARLVHNQGQVKTLAQLEAKYPACLAVYLVIKGVYGYQEGNYWSSVGEGTNFKNANIHQQLGQCFERFLLAHHLPTFPGVAGRRYVDIILLHGGIPDYSLDDFFARVLHPVIERPDLVGLNAREIISVWLDTSSQTTVDKPITRFLQHGGKLAVDFVARSLDMALYYTEHHRIPEAGELGLPQRIVDAYSQWVKNADRAAAKLPARGNFIRPSIILDPWGGNVFVDLPSQNLVMTIEQDQSMWSIQGEKYEAHVPLSARWHNGQWETEEYQIEFLPPASVYSITFETSRIRRSWRFQGITASNPLLIFDPESGNLLPSRDTLPAKMLWLLYPCGQTLQIEGGIKREAFPPLPDAWADYQVEAWDLSRASQLVLNQFTLTVEPDLSRLQPSLYGNEVTGLLHRLGEPRIFIGSAPILSIPYPQLRDPVTEAKRWHITLRTHEQAHTYTLHQLSYTVEQEAFLLSLAVPDLLGSQAVGNYELVLRGPLGRDTTFSFAVIPVLTVRMGHQGSIRLPNSEGRFEPTQFTLTTSTDLTLESSESAVTIATRQSGSYHVVVPGAYTQVMLTLSGKNQTSYIKVPLTLPLPLLHWACIEGKQAAMQSTTWQTAIITHSLAWLEQAESPRFLVSLAPLLETTPLSSGKLLVYYRQKTPPQVLLPRGQSRHWLTFNLAESLDSIRAGQEGHVQVELELTMLADHDKTVRIPVLYYTQDLDIQHMTLDSCLVDQVWLLALVWKGGENLRDRVLRLWSLWQPWKPPLTYSIADAALQSFYAEVPKAELSPGYYRAEIALKNPWSSQEDQCPTPYAPNTIEVIIGSDEERSTYLKQLPYNAVGYLEQALASQDAQTLLRALHNFDKCYQPDYMYQAFETLLLLQDKEIDEKVANGVVTLFQCHLVKSPAKLLALVASHSRGQKQHERWKYEELLARLAPGLGLGQLLSQIHLYGAITHQELNTLMPEQQNDQQDEAEIFSLLHEAGIRIQEMNSDLDTLPSDAQQISDIDQLYRELSEFYLDSIRQYLSEISQYPLLKPAQERQLALDIREGREAEAELQRQVISRSLLQRRIVQGKKASEMLINTNLRLVVSIAKKHIGQGMELLDLIQEGNLGLIRAISKFDGDKGYRFSTYATWWIRQAITRAIAEQRHLIRLPVHIVEDIHRLNRAKRTFLMQYGHDPVEEELAELLEISVEKVRSLQAISQEVLSFDASVGEDEEHTLGDMLPLEDADPLVIVEQIDRKQWITELLNQLKERQRLVLKLRFGLEDDTERTLEQVGQELGVTRERIRQIEEKALKNLRAIVNTSQQSSIFKELVPSSK